MKLLWDLIITFFKLGLFSFGGGYAMITLIQREIEQHGWLTDSQFADIVSIAEMTPGPVAVNAATYVGYETAGLAGGLVASAAVILPSLLLVLSVSGFIFRWQKHRLMIMSFYGLRPVVIGLIFTASLVIGRTALLSVPENGSWLSLLCSKPFQAVNPVSLIIFLLTLAACRYSRIHPLLVIGLAGLAGGVLYQLGLF